MMKTLGRFFSRRLYPVRTALCLLLLLGLAPVRAQFDTMPADELIREADLLLNTGRAVNAAPYLQAYLKRVQDVEETRIRVMAQDVRFKLGRIMIQKNDLRAADGYFQEYVKNRPALQWRDVMKFRSTTLMELKDFNACAEVTAEALAGPPADVREEMAAVAPPAKPEADGGYEFDQYGEVIRRTATAAAAAQQHPSGYSMDDLLLLHMNLGNALSALGRKEDSIAPFRFVIDNTSDEVHRGYAIMEVVNGLIERNDYAVLSEWMPQLARTDARYDIRVNMALLKAATALYDAKRYDSALPVFRMILPREELIGYQVRKLREMQIKAGLRPAEVTEEAGGRLRREDTLLGRRYTFDTEEFWSEEERTNPNLRKPKELIELEKMIETLSNLPPYEYEILYRTAYLYDDVSRPWEAVRFFDLVHKADPESELGQRAFYEMVRLLLDPLEEETEADGRAYPFLERETKGILPRQIAYVLTAFYQKHGRFSDIKRLRPYVEGFVPADGRQILKYDCELQYMQAIADLASLEYAAAEARFRKVLKDFPGSHQEDNATYWNAVAMQFQEKYSEALAVFESYPQKFPKGAWLAQAAFQSGTALFGLERYDEALLKFTAVIERYPDSTVYADACSLRGDIYGSRGLLDEAVRDYESAIAGAANQAQVKYATFQMAAVFEAEARYDEIIRVVNDYLSRYGEEADIATGIFWIGKTKINQGRLDEAVQSYFDAIVRYGGDLQQDGVDSMIGELVRLAKQRLSAVRRDALKADIRGAAVAGKPVLQLRLRAMLAQIDGVELAFGKQLIGELSDLQHAAPPVLAAICSASFDLKDYSRAAEILNAFKLRFEDSEFMRPAFKLRAYDLHQAGDREAALKLVAETQARYGTDYDMAWAQLMKGELLLQLGRADEAREAFLGVFNVPGWRGESFAEATFRLGQTEDAAGNPLKAHGWYQRVYVQYKGYAKGRWAADAYLSAARSLLKLGLTNDARNTYRAMLFDKFVNQLPQAVQAKEVLGASEVAEIAELVASGIQTNLTVVPVAEENAQ